VILINFGKEDFVVHIGDKIAQFIIESCYEVIWEEVATLPESIRSEGGR
jgi:dUTPase